MKTRLLSESSRIQETKQLTHPCFLVIGFSGCVVALIGECITVSVFSRTGDKGAASAAVFFLFLHVAIFTLCCDATSYVYASEIFPTPVRAKGLSVSVSGLFFATIIFTTAAPTAFADIGWKYYLIFVVLTSIITVYAYFTFPEVCAFAFPFFFFRKQILC